MIGMTATLKPCGIEGILTSYILNIEQVAASPTTPTARAGSHRRSRFAQQRKEGVMTKYYFASYLSCLGGGSIKFGHCLVSVVDRDLNQIAEMIQSDLGISTPVTILGLKDLTRREYKMLKKEKQPQTEKIR